MKLEMDMMCGRLEVNLLRKNGPYWRAVYSTEWSMGGFRDYDLWEDE